MPTGFALDSAYFGSFRVSNRQFSNTAFHFGTFLTPEWDSGRRIAIDYEAFAVFRILATHLHS